MKSKKNAVNPNTPLFNLVLLGLTLSIFSNCFAVNNDSLWSVWQDKTRHDTIRLQALKTMSWEIAKTDPDSGLHLANLLMKAANESSNYQMQAAAYKTFGLVADLKGDYEEALKYYNQALESAILANDRAEISNIYNNMGISHSALGNYEEALDVQLKSMKISEELKLNDNLVHIYANIGVIYSIKQNFPMAIEFFQRSLKLSEEIGDKRMIATNNFNIGLLYIQQENYQQAKSYLKESETLFKELNYQRALGTLYNSLGIIYKSADSLDKASQYYIDALDIANETGNKPLKARIIRNIGNVYELKGDFDNAMKSFREYLAITTEIENKNLIVSAKNDIGALYLEMGQPGKTIQWCEEAYKMAKENGYLEDVKNSCKFLSKAYKKVGNISNSYTYLEEYYFTRDSLDKLENEVEVERIVMKYEFEKQFLADSLTMVEKQLQTKLAYQESLNLEKNRQRTLLFAGILILLIAITIYSRLLYVRRNSKRLAEKNKIIEYEKQRAEESEKAKEIFFANVSHELRTPLTLIIGPLEKLTNSTSDGNLKRGLEMIKRNADRLHSMIDELLELFKLESGKTRLYVSEIELVEFLRQIVNSFNDMAETKKIKIVFTSVFDSCYVFADTQKLDKVINNLLSNAFKFTDEGGTIEVSVDCKKENEQEIIISVSDSGIGIGEEEQKRIFDRFYQVDDNTKRGVAGTGIGLALAKELVELHKGRIWVKSRVGEGSEFSFSLLKGKDHFEGASFADINIGKDGVEVGSAVENEPWSSNNTEDASDKEPLVLIVEDNEEMRNYIKSCITEVNYRVIEAKDGEEGYKMAVEKIPDMVVSDVMMPRMDGNEMCDKIKSDERTSHIPVVLVTARTAVEHKIRGIETGADAYVAKPFNEKELQTWVRKLIEQRKKLRKRFMKDFIPGLEAGVDGTLESMDEKFIKRAVEVVEKYISDSEFSVEKFSSEMALSRVQLHRKLKALTDQSSSRFIRTIRLKKATVLLKAGHTNVKETAYEVGFNNVSYFDKCFQNEFGMTPTEFISSNGGD